MRNSSEITAKFTSQEINPPPRRRFRIVPVKPTDGRELPHKRGRGASFKKADVVRAIAAAARAGINVGSVEVATNGSIRIYVSGQEAPATLFDQWRDKL